SSMPRKIFALESRLPPPIGIAYLTPAQRGGAILLPRPLRLRQDVDDHVERLGMRHGDVDPQVAEEADLQVVGVALAQSPDADSQVVRAHPDEHVFPLADVDLAADGARAALRQVVRDLVGDELADRGHRWRRVEVAPGRVLQPVEVAGRARAVEDRVWLR